MIDSAVILFSTMMCIIVVFRAIKLDGQMPWYGKGAAGAGPKFNPDLVVDDIDAP
jgi:hypothetical protein